MINKTIIPDLLTGADPVFTVVKNGANTFGPQYMPTPVYLTGLNRDKTHGLVCTGVTSSRDCFTGLTLDQLYLDPDEAVLQSMGRFVLGATGVKPGNPKNLTQDIIRPARSVHRTEVNGQTVIRLDMSKETAGKALGINLTPLDSLYTIVCYDNNGQPSESCPHLYLVIHDAMYRIKDMTAYIIKKQVRPWFDELYQTTGEHTEEKQKGV